jgi:predicted unusual protein kinase regulating ubiquinone biosynthesis (AarF/ABC1/UbiB family)
MFDEFDTDPISGASLGQVYEAELDGERVAVKVLRPGIRERVESDLRVLETLTPVLARGAEPAQAYTLENLSEEFAATIRAEMDYAHEARMLREIGASFADRDDVAIPEVVASHSSDRVVTMTYLDGVKIDDVEVDIATDRMWDEATYQAAQTPIKLFQDVYDHRPDQHDELVEMYGSEVVERATEVGS